MASLLAAVTRPTAERDRQIVRSPATTRLRRATRPPSDHTTPVDRPDPHSSRPPQISPAERPPAPLYCSAADVCTLVSSKQRPRVVFNITKLPTVQNTTIRWSSDPCESFTRNRLRTGRFISRPDDPPDNATSEDRVYAGASLRRPGDDSGVGDGGDVGSTTQRQPRDDGGPRESRGDDPVGRRRDRPAVGRDVGSPGAGGPHRRHRRAGSVGDRE